VLVGVLMMQGLACIDLTDPINALPVVLTLLVTALTKNLVNGMAGNAEVYSRWSSPGLLLQDSSDRLGAGGGAHCYAVVTAHKF
jgi:adenine/guanine/hypoxanthine permease